MKMYVYIAGIVIVLLLVLLVWRFKRHHHKLKTTTVVSRWRHVQAFCADRKQWWQAVVAADKLLDDVLKSCHIKGKSTGERLVGAQHKLSNNESVWFGHKLRNRITQEHVHKLSKQDTLEALSGFRQALKDLGAIPEPPSGAAVEEKSDA